MEQIYDMELVSDKICHDSYQYFIVAPNAECRSKFFYTQVKDTATFENIVIMDYENFHKDIDAASDSLIYKDFDMQKVIRIEGTCDGNELI